MTVEELRAAIGKNRYDRNNIEVLLFLEAARDWLTPPYRATDIDYADLDETTVTVELRNLSEAVDWTLNNQWDYVGLPSSLRTAAAALNDARNRYESLKENEDTGYSPGPQKNYDKIIYSVLDACSHVKWYPVAIEDDGNWDTFTDSADTLFHYLEKDSPSKIPVCLKPMQRALENMEDRAEEERGW